MSELSVYNHFLPQLTKSLPMKDPSFLAKLAEKELFYGNTKSKVKSYSTDAEAAEYFLDKIIEEPLRYEDPDTEPFEKLLKAIEEFDNQPLKKVAVKIRQKLTDGSGTSGGGVTSEKIVTGGGIVTSGGGGASGGSAPATESRTSTSRPSGNNYCIKRA